jgi:hypothetical protein
MKDMVLKLQMPGDLYEKVSEKAQRKMLSMSAYIRLLLLEDVGENVMYPQAQASEQAKEYKKPGAPSKLERVQARWRDHFEGGGPIFQLFHDHPPQRDDIYGPHTGYKATPTDRFTGLVLGCLKSVMPDVDQAKTLTDAGTWLKENACACPDWETDSFNALVTCVVALYMRANPE